MHITRLELNHFRNFGYCKVDLHNQLNVFFGANGSGKSSFLEAIYLLGFGRSFRTIKPNNLIKEGTDQFALFAQSVTDEAAFSVGLSRNRNGDFKCRVNGESTETISSLVMHYPIQLFTPQSTDLILGSPRERRRFMDWGVFHVKHSSQNIFKRYSKLHKQRNALLKNSSLNLAELSVWDKQFSETALEINRLRELFIEQLRPRFEEVLQVFLPEIILKIEYNGGWDKSEDLQTLLKHKLKLDRQYGNTSIGPHKADLKIKINNSLASEVLSRGQLRMTVAALQLAQIHAFSELTNRETIFLLDDLGAELDEEKRLLFLDSLVKSKSQIFVTAIEEKQLGFINNYDNKKVFHVEHGSVKEE